MSRTNGRTCGITIQILHFLAEFLFPFALSVDSKE